VATARRTNNERSRALPGATISYGASILDSTSRSLLQCNITAGFGELGPQNYGDVEVVDRFRCVDRDGRVALSTVSMPTAFAGK